MQMTSHMTLEREIIKGDYKFGLRDAQWQTIHDIDTS